MSGTARFMQRHGYKYLKINVSTGELEAIGYSGSEAAEFPRIPPGEQDAAKDSERLAPLTRRIERPFWAEGRRLIGKIQ